MYAEPDRLVNRAGQKYNQVKRFRVPVKRRRVFMTDSGEETAMNVIERISWILLQDGKLLAVRSAGKTAWYIPGGKREPGETDAETLIREVKEELNVELLPDSIRLYGVFEGPAHGKAEGTVVRLSCYTADYTGVLTPSSEVEELRWMSMADREILPPADLQIYEDLYSRGLLKE